MIVLNFMIYAWPFFVFFSERIWKGSIDQWNDWSVHFSQLMFSVQLVAAKDLDQVNTFFVFMEPHQPSRIHRVSNLTWLTPMHTHLEFWVPKLTKHETFWSNIIAWATTLQDYIVWLELVCPINLSWPLSNDSKFDPNHIPRYINYVIHPWNLCSIEFFASLRAWVNCSK